MENQFFRQMRRSVKHWYLPLIIGVILIGTGIWTFFSPRESYLALSLFFSVSFVSSGVLEVFFAIFNRNELDNWVWTLTLGVMTFLVGCMLLTHPGISMISLPLYVGFMVMFRSFNSIGIAMDLKSYGVLDWGTLMIIGMLGLVFSFILIWNPAFAGMTIVFWTGVALLTNGIFSVYMSFKMKQLHKNWDNISTEVKEKFEELNRKLQQEMESAKKY